MQLDDRVVVVTGAHGQLGRAMVAEATTRGARVASIDLHPGPASVGGRAWAADLAALDNTLLTFQDIAAHFGRIDALVNIAGGFHWQTLQQSADLTEWEIMQTMNLRTCVHACKAVLPHFMQRGHGRIVNLGAAGAVHAANGMGAYAAAKAGVMRLTEALADELKLHNITVNAVLPSIIDTPQNRADMPAADHSRWPTPAEIAKAIALLLTDDAAVITGALIPVTGRT